MSRATRLALLVLQAAAIAAGVWLGVAAYASVT